MTSKEVVVRNSDAWWEQHPDATRCKAKNATGSQCRRLAKAGAVVCTHHGAAAPQTRAKAAERLLMAADDAASKLIQWMSDESVPFQERRKIAMTVLDRGGLGGTKTTEVGVTHKFEETIKHARVEVVDDVVDAEVVTEPEQPEPEPDPWLDSDIPRSPAADAPDMYGTPVEPTPMPDSGQKATGKSTRNMRDPDPPPHPFQRGRDK